MSDGAEVAEDYHQALEDLSSNMRFEISNLTVIARENTEFALNIAEVLQDHILKAAPSKKLPALYVLDSIVKNVGTPYTLYFGRNLFKTFMESYAVVDQPVRRKMEEMLKTWKEPVPGSMDSRPVFSPELVRPIENALLRARAASMPQGSIPGRPRSSVPHRDTPTPPNMRGLGGPPGAYPPHGYPQKPNGGQQMPPQQHFSSQQPPYYPPHSTPQPAPSAQAPFQPPFPGMYGAPAGISIDTSNKDIQNLIVVTRAEASLKPHDAAVQNRLRALEQLRGILKTTGLPPEHLELVKKQVTELAADVNMRAPSTSPNTASSTPTPAPLVMPVVPVNSSQPPVSAPAAAHPSQGGMTIDALLGQGALAALLRQSATPQNSTPTQPPAYANVAIRSPPPAPVPVPQPQAQPAVAAPPVDNNNPMDLLARLRQAGMLPPVTPTNAGAAAPPPPPPAQIPPPAASTPMNAVPIIPANIASILSATKAMGLPGFGAPALSGPINVAALRHPFQPSLLSSLHDALGPPCSQCGRRFKTDQEGRKLKTAHMDWHFRVHQRTNEAEKRGMHRSWYVDQRDWLNSREVVDSDHISAPDEAAAVQATKDAEAAKPKYIPVPDPSRGVNNVCPICQDKFENKWLDTVQEWVWLDAVLVGHRAYHASCHAEATRDREGTPGASGYRRTPEPVLGKRKAEVSISSPKVRSLKTSA